MSLKKRFSLWAMLAIALAFCQPLKAENYGATVTIDSPREIDVTELKINTLPSINPPIVSRIIVKNGMKMIVNVGSVPNFQGMSYVSGGRRLGNDKFEVTEAGPASIIYETQAPGEAQKSFTVIIDVNYYGVLQYQGSDAPASIDVTLDNQNQTLSVPAGKFGAVWWFVNGTEEVSTAESITLKDLLATGHTSFTFITNDGTSNELPNGNAGGYSEFPFTLVDKRTPATVSVTGVTLSESAKTLTVGETFQITPNVQPPTATDPGVTWSVAPAGIVEVGTSGLVTAQAQGQATVTVKTNDGNHTAQCVVTVVPKKHRVHFSHTGSGALTATVDNAPIQTGAEVEAGKTVVFTAAPAAGHRVKAWTPANGTATTYTVTNLSAETTVTVATHARQASRAFLAYRQRRAHGHGR